MEHTDEFENFNFLNSPYYSHDEFLKNICKQKDNFCLLSLNCQSLNAKYDNICILLENLKKHNFYFSAICLQETWLREDADLSLFQIPGYTLVAQGTQISQHGGLAIYLHNNFTFNIFPIHEKSDTWEGLILKVYPTNNGKNIYIFNIYRPPHDDLTNEYMQKFIDELNIILTDLNRSKSIIVLLGDFNIDLLKSNRIAIRNFLENLISYGLYPSITLPTRLTDSSATLIDNLFTNYQNCYHSSGILFSQISDHLPYYYTMQIKKNYSKDFKQIVFSRKYNEKSFQNMFLELQRADIYNILSTDINSDPNGNYNILEDLLTKSLNKYMPIRRVNFHKHKHKKSNWITSGIIKSIKYRDNLYKLVKGTPNDTMEYLNRRQNLRVYNRILKRLIREAKRNFYNNKFDKYKCDSKKTWSTINEIMNKNNSKKNVDYFIINQNKISDKNIITNHFNNYFSQIGPSMASNIPHIPDCTFTNYLTTHIDTEFKFNLITENQTVTAIDSLYSKSSSGHDGISTYILKKLQPVITKPLTLIINQSINTGIFPDRLKLAKIIPIHKKNDLHVIENYRPISLLPAISKVFEKIIFYQVSQYFLKNNYLCESQYGFRQNFSTEHAILEIVDRVACELDRGNTPIAIFLDLSKAFDTLNHTILLAKLRYYGFHESTLNWFRSYLFGRSHYVEIDQITSSTVPNTVGVPQGSILGPLLFTIYINDIQYSSDYFQFIKYADDTTLFNNMILQDYDIINHELNKVNHWLCVNKLSLNPQKTKYIVFRNKNKIIENSIEVKLQNCLIEQVQNFNFLGITINQHLTWNDHIGVISNKILRSITILNRLKHYLPVYTLKVLYNSLILSQLTYGILAWGGLG